jgi:hypothetical protein
MLYGDAFPHEWVTPSEKSKLCWPSSAQAAHP